MSFDDMLSSLLLLLLLLRNKMFVGALNDSTLKKMSVAMHKMAFHMLVCTRPCCLPSNKPKVKWDILSYAIIVSPCEKYGTTVA